MKEKIDSNQKRKERGHLNVKLGKGGIREIEFFAQAIQLINGGKDPGIREKSTLKTLHCLRERAYITPEEEMKFNQEINEVKTKLNSYPFHYNRFPKALHFLIQKTHTHRF